MQGQIGSVVLVAVGIIILILALRGNLNGIGQAAKDVGNSQPTPTKSGGATDQPPTTLAPGSPGSGVTFQ